MLIHWRCGWLCPKLLPLLLLQSVVAVICAQAPNGTSAPKPTTTSAETGTTIKLRVNLVQVRVVVRDSKGNPVPGLTREDFQVSDNGKPQVITNFSIETRESRLERSEAAAKTQIRPPELANVPAPVLPDRFVMLVFDTGQMEVGDLIRSREAAAKFTLSPTDRVALYSTFKGEFTNDFTGNPEKVRAALAGISAVPDKETSHIVNGLGQPEATPGGQGTSQNLESASAPGLNFKAVLDAMGILSRMPGERILVLISPGFRGGLDSLDTTDERRLIDKANNSGVVVNTLDVRGLYVPDIHAPYAETMGTKQNKQNLTELRENLIAQREQSLGLLTLADETGGTCFRDSNDFDAGLKRLGAAPDVYYILGFTPSSVKLDGSYHKLKVTVTRLNGFGDPLYDTQARRGYFAPMQGGDPKKESHDELQDALFSQDEIRDFPFALQTQYVKKDGGEGQLDIFSRLQMKEVPFRLVDGRHVDSVTLATSIFDDNGNFVTGGQKVLDLNLLEPSYQKMVQAGLTVKTSFDLKPGKYMVRQVVRDSENSQMAARNGTAVIPH
jgi:VWFA-related protein